MIEDQLKQLTEQQRKFLATRLAKRGDDSASKRLVAWYCGDQPVDATKLRRETNARLPGWAVPQRFEFRSSLPRTSTGKVDRRQLVAERLTRVDCLDGEPLEEGDASTQSQLLGIWRGLFEDPSVGLDDDFFAIGGDSLRVIQLTALCQEAGIQVKAYQVNEYPTVRSLAQSLDECGDESATSPTHKTVVDDVRPKLSFDATAEDVVLEASPEFRRAVVDGVQGGLLPLSVHKDKPILFIVPPKARRVEEIWPLTTRIAEYTCYAPTTSEDVAQHRTVEDVAEEFLQQIRTVQPHGPYRLLGKCEGGHIAWVMAQHLLAAGEEVRFLGLMNTPNPTSLKLKGDSFKERWRRRWGKVQGQSWRSLATWLPRKAATFLKKRVVRAVTGDVSAVRGGSRMSWVFRPSSYQGHATLFHVTEPLPDDIYITDPTFGWGNLAEGGLDVQFVPGHSLTYYVAPFVGAFAKQLCLAIQMRDIAAAAQG